MHRILVPVDFSEHAEYALEVAAIIARRHNAEIMVLHMLGLTEAYLTKDELQEAAEAHYYMKLAKKKFDSFLDKPYLKGIKLKEMVQNYKIFSEINQVADEYKADLIVMGSHGSSGLSEIFVGSNTEKVVRSSAIPVMVIKVRRPEFELKKAVIATDFDASGIRAYQKLRTVLELWDIDIYLVYVNLPNEKFRSSGEIRRVTQNFVSQAHGNQLPDRTFIRYVSDYSIEHGIYDLADEIGADIICLATHGHSGLAHFFKGSLGEDLANHSNLPVMTCKI